MTFREAYSIAKGEFPARLATVRGMSYAELERLPPLDTSEVRHGDYTVRWTVYRDVLDEGRGLQIVVQLSIKSGGKLLGFFEMGNVDAEGFVIDPLGSASPLRPEDLYEFT